MISSGADESHINDGICGSAEIVEVLKTSNILYFVTVGQ